MAILKLPSLRCGEVAGFSDSCCPLKGQGRMEVEHQILEEVTSEISASGTSSKTLVRQDRLHACFFTIQASATTTRQGCVYLHSDALSGKVSPRSSSLSFLHGCLIFRVRREPATLESQRIVTRFPRAHKFPLLDHDCCLPTTLSNFVSTPHPELDT
jgi:hypothetical protein